MAPFARDMGYDSPPFAWDETDRLHRRARLDALYFLLYGVTDRDDVRYIYSTFPMVEREERVARGRYLPRDLCLAWMNALEAGDPDAEIGPELRNETALRPFLPIGHPEVPVTALGPGGHHWAL